VEIATHPIVRVIEADRVKPDPLPPHAGVCFVCDQHRIAKKLRLKPRRRREGGPRLKSFLVWPGGEAVKSRPYPAVSVVGRLHRVQTFRVNITPGGSRRACCLFLPLRNGADVALLMPDANSMVAHLVFVRALGPLGPKANHLRPSFLRKSLERR
jgi:hypothetical protein